MTIAHAYLEAREQLLEAVREIQLMAGIGDLDEPAPAAFAQLPAAHAGGGIGMRGFKAIRGSHAVAAPAPERAPRPLVIGVTSPATGDGRSTIAIALANCLAQDYGAHVTLVDADFDTAGLTAAYGLGARPGLSDVLEGAVKIEAATHRLLRPPLSVVSAGTRSTHPARAARSGSLAPAINRLKATSGFVVMDLPAALRSTNAAVLGARCDGVIVVVRAGATSRVDLDRALELLAGTHVLGVVVNRYETAIPDWTERLLALRR